MKASPTMLSLADLDRLHRFRISDQLLELHAVRRISDQSAREDCGIHYRGDLSGVVFPIYGADDSIKGYRVRRDNPEIENGQPKAKYVQSLDRAHLFFERTSHQWLNGTSTPIVFVEAYTSALAIAAWLERTGERFLILATSGCWGWRGTIGRNQNENGVRVDVKGPCADLDHIPLIQRKAVICFDANTEKNTKVQAAERAFKKELQKRGALVYLARLPEEAGLNGPDDYLALHTDEEFRQILNEPASSDTREVMRFTRMGDLLSEHEEELIWLVVDHLPMCGHSLLVAKPKVGKSTLARCLALAVARGDDFLGCHTAQGAVFYLALEEKRAEVRRHFRAMGANGNDPIFVFCATSPADGLLQLREAMVDEKPVLVIVDPLFRFVRMKDGNDYAAVTNALEPLHALARETGAHVMAVHHMGKGDRQGGDSVLGSTALFAAVDTLLMMKRNEKYRTLSSIQRYGTDLEEITLQYDEQTRTVSAGVTRSEADEREAAVAIIEFLKTQPEPVEEATIHDSVEGRKKVMVKALRQAVKDGTINRTGAGKKGDVYRYSVSSSLVPHIYGEQTKQESENYVTPSEERPDACSRPFSNSDDLAETRDPEKREEIEL
jgi:hypothetical protein